MCSASSKADPNPPPTDASDPQPSLLQDVFFSSAAAAHPSDIPRLQSRHQARGYLQGLGAGRAHTAQPGFDAGFERGAALGLRVGAILGSLAALGVADAVLRRAREALALDRVLAATEEEEELLSVWSAVVETEARRRRLAGTVRRGRAADGGGGGGGGSEMDW